MMIFWKLICGSVLFGFAWALNAQNIPWERFQQAGDDPASKVFKDYALVENIPLVMPSIQAIPAEYFAISSILRFFEMSGNAKYPFLDAPVFLAEKINPQLDGLLESPNPDKKKIIISQLDVFLNSFRKNAQDIAEKAGIAHPTDGQLLALLLHKISTDPNEALQKMLYDHFYAVKPLRKLKADKQVAKVLLNIGIPFILKDKDQLSICAGYWEDKNVVRFLVCDLSQTVPVKISQKEFCFLRRKTTSPKIAKDGDKVMVEDDLTFSLNNKSSFPFCRAITWIDDAEMIIVNKPSFNDDILKDFLQKKIEIMDVKK